MVTIRAVDASRVGGITGKRCGGAPSVFGAVLREHRTAAELSQGELARAAGCTTSHVSLLEAGARQPSRSIVLALAAALGLTTARTDRLLYAGGLAPQTDYQALYEAAHGAVDEQRKWCRRCQEDCAVSRFSVDRSRPDGRSPLCKPCESARQQAIRARAALAGRAS